MDLFDLKDGDLFILVGVNNEAYVYRKVGVERFTGDVYIREVYNRTVSGAWVATERSIHEKYNPYAQVRKVAVILEIVHIEPSGD